MLEPLFTGCLIVMPFYHKSPGCEETPFSVSKESACGWYIKRYDITVSWNHFRHLQLCNVSLKHMSLFIFRLQWIQHTRRKDYGPRTIWTRLTKPALVESRRYMQPQKCMGCQGPPWMIGSLGKCRWLRTRDREQHLLPKKKYPLNTILDIWRTADSR